MHELKRGVMECMIVFTEQSPERSARLDLLGLRKLLAKIRPRTGFFGPQKSGNW